MGRIKASYWEVEQGTYKLQIQTKQEQDEIQKILPGWKCVSFGYVPSTSEEILIFEKNFNSEKDWTNFTKTDTIIKLMELREV